MCPDGILPSAKCVTHQSFGRSGAMTLVKQAASSAAADQILSPAAPQANGEVDATAKVSLLASGTNAEGSVPWAVTSQVVSVATPSQRPPEHESAKPAHAVMSPSGHQNSPPRTIDSDQIRAADGEVGGGVGEAERLGRLPIGEDAVHEGGHVDAVDENLVHLLS